MALSEKDISAIRRTWAAAAALPDLACQLFYGHLFRIAPETKPLFRNDMASQAKKLIATIAFVVDHLDNSSSLFPAAADLAVRHVSTGSSRNNTARSGRRCSGRSNNSSGTGSARKSAMHGRGPTASSRST